VGIGLVALLVLDWIVYVIMVSHLRSKANEAFAPVPPPRQVIMCDSGPTPGVRRQGRTDSAVDGRVDARADRVPVAMARGGRRRGSAEPGV
jgi:hypothetical protein